MNVDAHEDFLRDTVYFTKTRWPFYELLLADLRNLSAEEGPVWALERRFNKESRLTPYFQNFGSIECQKVAKAQTWWPLYMADQTRPVLVVIHNLLHHVRDVEGFMADVCKRILAPGGRLYVFEPLFRELHQEPDHWQMFTPYGMMDLMRRHGLHVETTQRTGDAFEAAAYCLDQALQYIPERALRYVHNPTEPRLMGSSSGMDVFAWKMRVALKHLMERPVQGLDVNQVREHTSFPTAYSVVGRRPK